MAQVINTHSVVAADNKETMTLDELDSGRTDCKVLTLSSEQTADLVGERASQFERIEIDFPKFADGRGYSAARLLREKYGFKGDLRAVGDVLIDQLFFMARCGFSTFALRDDQDINVAFSAFNTFSDSYQNDVHDQRPLFRRRLS